MPDTTTDTTAIRDHQFPPRESLSWGPVRYTRLRSMAAGVMAALGVVFVLGMAILSGLVLQSGELLLFIGILLLVGGPFSLLYLAIAYEGSTAEQKQWIVDTLRSSVSEWSQGRPLWFGCGFLSILSLLWLGWDQFLGPILIVGFVVSTSIVTYPGRTTYRLVPETRTIEASPAYLDRSWSRSLAWLIGVRRVDIRGMAVLILANRGRQWYSGPNVLVMSSARADSVEQALTLLIEQRGPPERASRTDRLILGGFGLLLLMTAPLLYVLSGEPVVFFVLSGPWGLLGLLLAVMAARM